MSEFMTHQYRVRDFHILSDAKENFRPIDGICQFEFRGYQISVSTAGLSVGACQTEVAVFKGESRREKAGLFHTVEEAIDFVIAETTK